MFVTSLVCMFASVHFAATCSMGLAVTYDTEGSDEDDELKEDETAVEEGEGEEEAEREAKRVGVCVYIVMLYGNCWHRHTRSLDTS